MDFFLQAIPIAIFPVNFRQFYRVIAIGRFIEQAQGNGKRADNRERSVFIIDSTSPHIAQMFNVEVFGLFLASFD
jgi:hypothetical protein